MDRKKLAKIKRELETLSRSPQGIQHRILEKLARKLGRKESNHGKEPNWDMVDGGPKADPLSIPKHKPELRVGTALSIIDHLLNDVDLWEQYLDQENLS